jgi:1-phosphofructokinase family hexose kinase
LLPPFAARGRLGAVTRDANGGIVIAGPNLTLDRTLRIDELRPGEVLRFSEAAITPGGKGVNVARVARALGLPAVLVGLAPGRTGAAVAELLRDEELEVAAVPVPGEVRAASVILEASGRVTVLNEPGPSLPEDGWDAYTRAVDSLLEDSSLLVCSGSIPPGAPADAYAQLTEIAHARGIPALVDAAGPALAAALGARPDYAAPNLFEAEDVLGTPSSDGLQPPHDEARDRALAAAAGIAARGAAAALVTAGEAGVALAAAGATAWHDTPRVEVVNPVGAGDSFVGGLAAALARGAALEEAVGFAIATAAASVETALAGGIDRARVEALAAARSHPA